MAPEGLGSGCRTLRAHPGGGRVSGAKYQAPIAIGAGRPNDRLPGAGRVAFSRSAGKVERAGTDWDGSGAMWGSDDEAAHSVLQAKGMEIQEQSDVKAAPAQIGQKLCVMHREEGIPA